MREERLKKICVVGTGTDVGKSVLSLLLMQYFTKRGMNPFYLKPFQTGCESPDDPVCDARFIYDHLPAFREKDPADSIVHCFREPKAPWFAARNEGKTADLETAIRAIDEKAATSSPLIIEGAGGILVPINDRETMVDLLVRSGGTPVVAAAAGLGTINHTLLTLEVLRSRGIKPAGVILMNGMGEAVPEAMIAENSEAIEAGSGIPVCGVIGRIKDFSAPDKDTFEIFDKLFSGFGE